MVWKCIFAFSLIFILNSCSDDNEPESDSGESVVGRWQKYQVMDSNGDFSEGDLDEFWIFYADGSFKNEDSGSITTTGYYTVEGSMLNIFSHSTDDMEEEENFSGNYVIEDEYMTYTFTDLRDGEELTIRFKRM